jgi:hypothetical protein
VGPTTGAPSWMWCGHDIAMDLMNHFRVFFFASFKDIKKQTFDLGLVIKHPPEWGDQLPATGKKVYVPVDFFESPEHIASYSHFLSACDLVLVHTERLIKWIRPYARRVEVIEHYAKHALPEMVNYREVGDVVWVGYAIYFPFIRDWYNSTPKSFRLQVVTDQPNRTVSGDFLVVSKWSEDVQRQLFEMAKGGIDLKGDNFSQLMKPPTKVQQLVASGIPTATNRTTYAWEYFHKRGFDLVEPSEVDRWFSIEYWRETIQMAKVLKVDLAKSQVVGAYHRLLDSLL